MGGLPRSHFRLFGSESDRRRATSYPMARIDSAISMLNRVQSVIDLNEQVLGTLGMLRNSLGEGIALSALLSPQLEAVRVDPIAMQEAVLHLAGIARESLPSGGSLLIETQNISFSSDDACVELGLDPGEYVCIAVSNNGTGMSIAVPSDCTMGLFLAPVYAFAKRSGGTATIRSEPGQGTTVRLYLPRAPNEMERPREGVGQAVGGNAP